MAPLLVLAGVAAAFLPMFDPAYRLAVAAPFSGFTLLLVRAVCALAAALVPVAAAAFVAARARLAARRAAAAVAGAVRARARGRDRHGPPRRRRHGRGAVGAAGAAAGGAHVPLLVVQAHAQFACAAVLCACAAVLLARRDRFELGWMR